MPSLKYIPDQIMWHDGMLLSPQHFQQAFKRCENIIRYHSYETSPFPFGVKKFSIDEASFASGVLKIDELECIFQDGLEYYFNSLHDSSSLKIDLTKYKEILTKGLLTLNLCIPRIQNVNNVLNNEYSRYKSIETDHFSFDENTGEDEVLIPRIRPNIRFLFEHELTPHYIALPILKIYMENNIFKTFEFAPPTTKITRKSPIWNICHSICMSIRYKIQATIESFNKFDKGTDRIEYFNRMMTLKSMKACLPKLEICLYSEQIHPFHLFLEVYQVVAQIISNDAEEIPPPLIEYNHFNNLDCFFKLKTMLTDYLEREIPTDFEIIKTTKIDNKYFISVSRSSLNLNDTSHLLFGFKKNPQNNTNDFINWIKSAIICEENELSLLLDRRVLGLPRMIVEKYENLIPQRDMFLALVKIDMSHKEKLNLIFSPSIDENTQLAPEEIIFYTRKKS